MSDSSDNGLVCWIHPDLRSPKILNPYFRQLNDSLCKAGIRSRFGFWQLWFSQYDIVHIHFPQHIAYHRVHALALLKTITLLGGMAVARLRGRPVVWTMHNSRPHVPAPWPWLAAETWKLFQRLASGTIYLSDGAAQIAEELYPKLAKRPSAVIPHGHYQAVIPRLENRESARQALGYTPDDRLLAFLGSVRAYKGCVDLVRSFNDIADHTGLHLVICGNSTPIETAKLDAVARGIDNVHLQLEQTSDEAFDRILAACNLVVLPFVAILNSGSVLFALSAWRPVCAPKLGSLTELQSIVGTDWLYLYDAPLTANILLDALKWATGTQRLAPDLSRFDWDTIGAMHKSFYKRLVLASCASASRSSRGWCSS